MNSISQGSPLNLSTGIATSFIEFAGIATNLLGYQPTVRGDTTMPEGVASRVGNTSKQNSLGFVDKRTFEEGVAEGIEFLIKNN